MHLPSGGLLISSVRVMWHTHTHTHTHTRAHTHTCIHTYTHMYTHTQIYTHTQRETHLLPRPQSLGFPYAWWEGLEATMEIWESTEDHLHVVHPGQRFRVSQDRQTDRQTDKQSAGESERQAVLVRHTGRQKHLKTKINQQHALTEWTFFPWWSWVLPNPHGPESVHSTECHPWVLGTGSGWTL